MGTQSEYSSAGPTVIRGVLRYMYVFSWLSSPGVGWYNQIETMIETHNLSGPELACDHTGWCERGKWDETHPSLKGVSAVSSRCADAP